VCRQGASSAELGLAAVTAKIALQVLVIALQVLVEIKK
jgi:hypothetical protein